MSSEKLEQTHSETCVEESKSSLDSTPELDQSIEDDFVDRGGRRTARSGAYHENVFYSAVGDEDYTRKYPDDDYGAEMGSQARVFKVYNDETGISDREYISDNNATLDGILIFASIFSAMVTTFVTQTYQSLFQDPQAVVIALLAESVSIQRAAANGSLVSNTNSPSVGTMATPFTPNTSDMWINGLWFISLTLSLMTAFLGVLSKQWLYQYIAVISGSPRSRALTRQLRNSGLHDWHVPTLISILPVILQIALALFFVGLVILLRTMLVNIAYFIASLVGSVYLAYFISSMLPIFYPNCPYRTGLTPKLYHLYQALPLLLVQGESLTVDRTSYIWPSQWLAYLGSYKISVIPPTARRILWKDAERMHAHSTKGAIESKIVSWLYKSSYNPSAKQIALEAFAGLRPEHDQYEWDCDMMSEVEKDLQGICMHLSTVDQGIEDVHRQLELCLRAMLQIHPFLPPPDPTHSGKLPVPDDAARFWYKNDANIQLNTLLECGLYSVGHRTIWAEDFLSRVTESQTGSCLPPGIWVSILKTAQDVISDRRYFLGDELKLIVSLLSILEGLNYFAGAEITDELSSTTIQRPNMAMCEAMLQCIRSSAYQHIVLPDNSTTRVPLELLDRLGLDSPRWLSTEDDLLSAINVVLSCLLQSNNGSKRLDTSPMRVWTLAEKRVVNHECQAFMQTTRFSKCASKIADPLSLGHQIFLKVITLVEESIPLPGLNALDIQPSLEISRAAFENILSTYLYYPGFSENWDQLSPSNSRWKRGGGSELYCLAFDQNHEAAYEAFSAMDVIPDLFHLWSKEYQRLLLSNALHDRIHTTVPIVIQHYLGGILQERERATIGSSTIIPAYASQNIEYIYQPDNLYHLCLILLRNDDWLPECQAALLDLLKLDPGHPGWIEVMYRLKQWKPEDYNPLEDRNFSETDMSFEVTLKRVYEGIHDMQEILAMKDTAVEFQGWKSRYEKHRDHCVADGGSHMGKLLTAYKCGLSRRSIDSTGEWKLEVRRFLQLERMV